MKKGLVLEGGGMRGIFTVGVLDTLMENGIEFDGIIGVSAGAAFGCNYKSRQAGRAIRYNVAYCKDKRFCSVHSLIKTGDMFGAEFCYHTLPETLDIFDTQAFAENPVEFYVVCTDIESGKPIYHRCDKADYQELEWMRASASMPLVSRIVEIDGRKMLDGGISDSIPLEYFEGIGYDRNLTVLTQPRDYLKKKNSLMPLIKSRFKKHPHLVETMAKRHDIYNGQREYVSNAEKEGRTLVICPDEALPIGRVEHDPKKLMAVYEAGRKIAEKNLDDIKNFLS